MKKGFTLIELLVVVLIIGILAAVALPQYQRAVVRSKFVQIELDLRALSQAQERYYLANSTNAQSISDLDIEVPPCKCLPGTCTTCSYTISVPLIYTTGDNMAFYLWFRDASNCAGTAKRGVLYAGSSVPESIRKALGFTQSIALCGTYYYRP